MLSSKGRSRMLLIVIAVSFAIAGLFVVTASSSNRPAASAISTSKRHKSAPGMDLEDNDIPNDSSNEDMLDGKRKMMETMQEDGENNDGMTATEKKSLLKDTKDAMNSTDSDAIRQQIPSPDAKTTTIHGNDRNNSSAAANNRDVDVVAGSQHDTDSETDTEDEESDDDLKLDDIGKNLTTSSTQKKTTLSMNKTTTKSGLSDTGTTSTGPAAYVIASENKNNTIPHKSKLSADEEEATKSSTPRNSLTKKGSDALRAYRHGGTTTDADRISVHKKSLSTTTRKGYGAHSEDPKEEDATTTIKPIKGKITAHSEDATTITEPEGKIATTGKSDLKTSTEKQETTPIEETTTKKSWLSKLGLNPEKDDDEDKMDRLNLDYRETSDFGIAKTNKKDKKSKLEDTSDLNKDDDKTDLNKDDDKPDLNKDDDKPDLNKDALKKFRSKNADSVKPRSKRPNPKKLKQKSKKLKKKGYHKK